MPAAGRMVATPRCRADGRWEKTDLTRYPAREGFEDLVMLHHKDSEDFAWTARVVPTALPLGRPKTTHISSVMGVAAIPVGFDCVKSIQRTKNGIRLHAEGGPVVKHAVDLDFFEMIPYP